MSVRAFPPDAPGRSDEYPIAIAAGLINTQDEGSPLSSTVGTLNFVGGPITATGGGATTTVTVSSAPPVLSPAYAATVTVDLTNYSTYGAVVVEVGTLTGPITFDITNGTNGQIVRVWFTQDGTGSRIFTAGSHLRFSTDTPSPTLSTAASKVDSLGFQWRSVDSKAWLVAVNKGY